MALVQEVKNGQLVDNTATGNSLSKKNEKEPGALGKEDFLKLMVAQMQYQDPLEPQSNTEYVSQLATFTQVEASENMVATMEQMEANNLVGKTAIMKPTNPVTGESSYITGVVDYVTREGSNVYLSVGGSLYNLDDLDTVSDTEYMDAVTLSNTFKELVNKLPGAAGVTLGDEAQITSVRAVYDGMTDYQKGFVSSDDLKILLAAEEKLNMLKALQDAINNGAVTDDEEKEESEEKTEGVDPGAGTDTESEETTGNDETQTGAAENADVSAQA